MSQPKVVVCIPVGRRVTLELLFPHIFAARNQFDECQLWMNPTYDKHDTEYIMDMVETHKDIFTLVDDGKRDYVQDFKHYGRYYETLPKDETVYVKMDDDILWISKNAISDLVTLRLDDPRPLIFIPNIINNCTWNITHNELGFFPDYWRLNDSPHCASGHYDGTFAEAVHRRFLAGLKQGTALDTLCKERVFNRPLGKHTPNHVYAFIGKDREWTEEDEKYITVNLTELTGRPVKMAMKPLFVHYGHHPQWVHLKTTDILERYKEMLP